MIKFPPSGIAHTVRTVQALPKIKNIIFTMPKRNVPPPPRVLRISQIPHSVFSFIIIQHAPLSVRAPWTASPSRTATPTATWFYMLPNTGSLVVSCNPGVDWSAPVALRMTLSISDLIASKGRSEIYCSVGWWGLLRALEIPVSVSSE